MTTEDLILYFIMYGSITLVNYFLKIEQSGYDKMVYSVLIVLWVKLGRIQSEIKNAKNTLE